MTVSTRPAPGPAPAGDRALQRWAVVALLLVGVALRWAALGDMGAMLHYDEAYNAMDALSLLAHPRLTPFFPGNFGREAGFVYWSLPFVGLIPGSTLAPRLAGTTLGILTLAAATKLGRELFGRRGAVWTLAALAGLYWHVHISHLALRANLYVLLGTLAAAWLLRAHRTRRPSHWLLAGVAGGLLIETYFAAYGWLALTGFCLALWALVPGSRRRGAALAAVAAVVTMLPMVVYGVANWRSFVSRPGTVVVRGWTPFAQNLGLWARALFATGDLNAEFNLPGRPILDPPLGVLFVIGIPALGFAVRRRWHVAWFAAWAFLAAMPSLLSDQAPHFLRGAGLTVPIALVIGAGAAALAQLAVRWTGVRVLAALPLVALALAVRHTAVDFHRVWLNDPETVVLMEAPTHRAIDAIAARTPADVHVYFSPFTVQHPVIGYRAPDLAPRPLGAFDSHQCLVLPGGDAIYVSLTPHEPGFQDRLARWLDVAVLEAMEYPWSPVPRVTVFAASPRAGGLPAASPNYGFGNAPDTTLWLQLLEPVPAAAARGDVIPVVLAVRADQPPARPLSVLVHLYGDPLPQDGGRLWAQADSQICASYPVSVWKAGETLVQSFELTLPVDLPAGVYPVVVGVYWFPDGPRLPVTAPATPSADTITIGEIAVD